MEGLIIGFGSVTITGLFAVIGGMIAISRRNGKAPNGMMEKLEEISTSHERTATQVEGLCGRMKRLEDWRDKQ